MDECCSHKAGELESLARQKDQRRVLIIVLLINAVMFAAEFITGRIAGSVSLMADAVDMFGDAMVYGVSLYALDKGDRWRNGAALAKGVLILVFGIGVLNQAGVKAALAANVVCLGLLWRFRKQDINMSSTFECSRNDVIANFGVLAAAASVALLNSPWADILIGFVISALFLRSTYRVLVEAWSAFGRRGRECVCRRSRWNTHSSWRAGVAHNEGRGSVAALSGIHGDRRQFRHNYAGREPTL